MLYIQTWERKELGKMYKVLKDIPYYKRVSAGDVVISCLAEEDRAYPRNDEEREWFSYYSRRSLYSLVRIFLESNRKQETR